LISAARLPISFLMSSRMSASPARRFDLAARSGIPLHGIDAQKQGPLGFAIPADLALRISDLRGGKICANCAFSERAGE
jgi:hypothetical protein